MLAGRADLDDVLQPYGDTGLSVLAAGPIPLNPAALLGSRHMTELLQRLRERADLVIIDTPPLLPRRGRRRPGPSGRRGRRRRQARQDDARTTSPRGWSGCAPSTPPSWAVC